MLFIIVDKLLDFGNTASNVYHILFHLTLISVSVHLYRCHSCSSMKDCLFTLCISFGSSTSSTSMVERSDISVTVRSWMWQKRGYEEMRLTCVYTVWTLGGGLGETVCSMQCIYSAYIM